MYAHVKSSLTKKILKGKCNFNFNMTLHVFRHQHIFINFLFVCFFVQGSLKLNHWPESFFSKVWLQNFTACGSEDCRDYGKAFSWNLRRFSIAHSEVCLGSLPDDEDFLPFSLWAFAKVVKFLRMVNHVFGRWNLNICIFKIYYFKSFSQVM